MIKNIIFLFLICIVLCGCTRKQEKNLYSSIMEKDNLIVGISIDAKPFGFKDSDGKIKGFEADLAREIAKRILGDSNKVIFKDIPQQDRLKIAPYSLEQFMLGQSVSGMTDIVSIHIIKALNAADAANQEMKLFFRTTSDVISQNNKGITQSVNNTALMTKNLAQMAENLNEISKKLNDSIDSNDLKRTTSNITQTTDSVAKATENIDKTVQKIDDTITQANAAATNLNSISAGLNDTLSRRFGGMRIIFGTPVKKDGQVKNACN